MLVGVAVALGSTWLGLAISWYFAYPVSFFIISISFVVYAAVRVASWAKERAVRATAVA
jgi:ABC-type Mn2+/Zn2+ transport system permease subunit